MPARIGIFDSDANVIRSAGLLMVLTSLNGLFGDQKSSAAADDGWSPTATIDLWIILSEPRTLGEALEHLQLKFSSSLDFDCPRLADLDNGQFGVSMQGSEYRYARPQRHLEYGFEKCIMR